MNNYGLLSCMSYFGTALKQSLERKSMKAVRVAEISGVSQSNVSRYLSGDLLPSRDDLAKVIQAVTSDRFERAELLRARLLDEASGTPWSEEIDISVRGRNALKEDAWPYRIKLPNDINKAIKIIGREAAHDAEVKELLLALANLIRRGTVQSENSEEGPEK